MAVLGTRGAARGRLRGGQVGAIAGAGWGLYGLHAIDSPAIQLIGGAATLVVLALLLREANRLSRAATALPGPAGGDPYRRSRTIWFLAIVAGEILLLNLAVWLLSAPPLHIYWVSAIALVVGLHFAPLAVLFRLRAFWATAAAVTALAIVTACAIRFVLLSPALADALLGFGTALALWITAAAGFADVRAAITGRRAAV